MISDRDFNKIAAAGNCLTSDEKADVRRSVEGWAEDIFILLEDQKQNLTRKQQLDFLQRDQDLLNDLIQHRERNAKVVLSLCIAGQQRHVSKKLTGPALERALVDIPRHTSIGFEELIKQRNRENLFIAQLRSDPLLHVIPNAAKPALDYLAHCILFFLFVRGKLGPKMPSESDWQVKFAREVFNVLLKDTLHLSASRQSDTWTLSAVRKRLATQFDRVQGCKKQPRKLRRERAQRAEWVDRVRVEFRKVPHVSEQDARDFAHGIGVDLTRDPKEVVRQEVASWNT